MEIMQSEGVVLEPFQSLILGKPLLRVVRVMQGDHPSLPSVSVYFQGCDAYPKCLGCHNPETWDFDEKFAIDFSHLVRHVVAKLDVLLNVYDKVALVLLGGEPLSPRNRKYAYILARVVKEVFQERVVVLVYSWRTPKDLLELDVPLDYFDEYVLGRYLQKYHRDGFPASANQLYLTKEELKQIFETLKINNQMKKGEVLCSF
ncbi:MAG: 4Fe-4S cluster-binding domain-containing protein [Fervidobacterium sp.]|uniref:4Fe-4S cluster-binding domain-containing protein n=1 Tax=Fervidobacterium sp. TaxID=1871331 RepID=UPI0025C521AC|nr:4Fe-4S cluster-binding domain-containing protein [Fervidobacterium sp.]NPU88763.1 4Fe-4S cluster-binding domain-containing protein [Fervidobacterium sp.]